MLEQNDLNAIQDLLSQTLLENNEHIGEQIDARAIKTEKLLLDEIDTRTTKTEKLLLDEIDARTAKTENLLLHEIDARAIKTEKLLLDEIERTRGILEKQIETVQKNLNEINQYYRITKLENDNTTLLLKMIDELSKRIAELEKKTA